MRLGARVNASARFRLEPADRIAPDTGFGLSAALRPALERALEWAGDGLVALVLSGSHARGEAVWAELHGQRVALSDLDVYAIMADEPSCAVARARAAGSPWQPAGAVMAPLEVAFVTVAGLARSPARPGTIELARSGRVVAGDVGVLSRLPRWEPSAVSAEERRLLLENRAFELLAAFEPAVGELGALSARHAMLKVALDAAASRLLTRGEWPATVTARVQRARELPRPLDLPSWLERAWEGAEPLWEEALASRTGAVSRAPTARESLATWHAAVRAWAVAWWVDPLFEAAPADPWERALHAAARGSWARRLRRSVSFRARTGATPAFAARMRRALAGTPAMRIHGSAVVLLLAAAQSSEAPRMPAGALRALSKLGVIRSTDYGMAARDTFLAWDRMLHDGLRTREHA